MRLFLCLTVFLVMAAPPARSADLFVRSPASKAAHEKAPEAPPPEPEAAPPPQAEAPAESINEFAGRYYKNCMSQEDSVLKGANQQMLCACSAQKLVEEMTVDDVRTMAADTPEGQFQRNRMLLQVYAPCMEFPARALLHENCINGEGAKSKVGNLDLEEVCSCMADGMGHYIAENGPSIIAKSLRDNPADTNPLSSLMNSPDFMTRAQAELTTCLTAPPAAAPAQ